jgi:predicted esterase
MTNPHKGQPLALGGAPLAQSRCAVVLIHGRGRDTADVLSLAERIGLPDVAYLAPAAHGGTWYPYSFLEPVEKNEPNLSYALEIYAELIADLVRQGFATERIVLAGFSQGACLTAEYAVRNPARYGGVLAFTGGLIGPPGSAWAQEGSFAETPILIGGSSADAFVPLWRMRQSAEIFGAMGAQVTELFYAGDGHLVSDEEIAAARRIISQI